MSVAITLSIAVSAHAGGINLSWDDCGTFGTPNKSFACDTNVGSQTLVVSYEPLATMANMVGIDVRIDIMTDSSTLPDWWKMFVTVGNCRSSAISSDADFTASSGSCANVWVNQAGGIGSMAYVNGNPSRASLLVFWAMLTPVQVEPGTQYYACKVIITNDKTTGAGSCAGCATSACAVLSVLQIDGDSNNSQKIEFPLERNFATWQSGTTCYTPTRRSSWGAIKSLYR